MIHTPNIDRLSAEGVRLESYYVQPLCSPTRGTIMTGRYVSHTGIGPNVIKPTAPYAMPKAEVFLPEFMRRAGYETAAVGKWVRACSIRATCLLRRLTRIRCTLFVLSRTALRVYEVGPHAHLPRL